MPSDAAPGAPPAWRRWLARLSSQGLGVACGLATALLLAVGSVILTATADGASAAVRMDDVTAFFEHPAAAHGWFYALIVVLGVYALNTLLCTWQATVRKLRAGVRAPSAYAPALMHVAFLLALVAHGVGGLWGAEQPPVVVGPAWSPLGDGREARVVDLREARHPGGEPRQVYITVETRQDGRRERAVIAYNQPLSSGLGAELLLLTRYGRPAFARLADGRGECLVAEGGSCRLGSTTLLVQGIHRAGHWGDRPLVVASAIGGPQAGRRLMLLAGQPQALGGVSLRLQGIEQRPVVMLRRRHAPGNPWALFSVLLMAAGVLLMGRRWL